VIAAVGVVGALSMFAGAAVQAQADTRYWKNLPDTVHVHTMKCAENAADLDVRFFDFDGREIGELARKVPIHRDPKGNCFAWVRSRRATQLQ
jgi:hypothetical protein